MIEVRQTAEFTVWLHRLKDVKRFGAYRYAHTPHGTWKSWRRENIGKGVMEMRIDYGPGYRVYYVSRGAEAVVLLCGGDKRTQRQDIKRAHELAESF